MEKIKEKEVETTQERMTKIPSLFPYRLKKKVDEDKFSKFKDILKQLIVYVTLVEALEQLSGYAKLIKDLMTKKV